MGNIHIIPDLQDIERILNLAERYSACFEYNDFFVPDILVNADKVSEIIKRYRELGRDCSEDTMHGAFFDVTICSADPDIRRISQDRIFRSMDVAQRLGIKGVVVHTNYITGFNNESYVNDWIEKNAEFFILVLEKFPDVEVYMENMWDDEPYLLSKVYRKINNERFGVCFDVAHANLHKLPLGVWLRELHAGIKHMHINDNDKISDLHETVGTMSIDWRQYDSDVRKYNINASVLIETRDFDKMEKSLEYLKENRYYPFSR